MWPWHNTKPHSAVCLPSTAILTTRRETDMCIATLAQQWATLLVHLELVQPVLSQCIAAVQLVQPVH